MAASQIKISIDLDGLDFGSDFGSDFGGDSFGDGGFFRMLK